MGRFIRTTGIVSMAVGLLLASERAEAQPPPGPVGPALAPPFSPYLNLVRPSTNPGIAYFGIVRPQNQFANQLQTLQQQSPLFSPFATTSGEGDQPFVTGNAFGFQNYRAYFQNQFTAGSSGLIGGGRRVPPSPGMGPLPGGTGTYSQYVPQAGAALPGARRR